MKPFDPYIKQRLAEESAELPDSVKEKIEAALSNLPEADTNQPIIPLRKQVHRLRRPVAAAACAAFIFVFLLPNVSVVYAQALEQVPVIGSLVKVVTIRNYLYSDETHEMDVRIPSIEDTENPAAIDINADMAELTERLVQQFYTDVDTFGEDSHGSLYVDYEIVTNTDTWFTLKLCVTEVAGSSNSYYRYYNLDKLSGKIVTLADIAKNDGFYEAAEKEIKRQMAQRMQEDSNSVYWIEDNSLGEEFVNLTPDHNFFWDTDGNLVIPFDKYEVAPGYMGTSEFTIKYENIRNWIKTEADPSMEKKS
jgi:hypothetical protein